MWDIKSSSSNKWCFRAIYCDSKSVRRRLWVKNNFNMKWPVVLQKELDSTTVTLTHHVTFQTSTQMFNCELPTFSCCRVAIRLRTNSVNFVLIMKQNISMSNSHSTTTTTSKRQNESTASGYYKKKNNITFRQHSGMGNGWDEKDHCNIVTRA